MDRRVWLIGVMLLALALRVVRLDFQPLWWDEGYSVFVATRDFFNLIERTAIDIHPPLYYMALQVWLTIFGKSDLGARWLSVLIGVATIPLIYALARQLFADGRVALIAAFLLAISPFHVYYSQEVRMYGLVTLLGLASVYFFAQLLTLPVGKPKTILVAAAYIGVTTAALYTQYYASFIVIFEILFVGVTLIRNSQFTFRNLLHWLGAWLAMGLLYLPWIVYAGPKLFAYVTAKVGIEKYPPLDPLTFLAQHFAAFATGHLTTLTWLAWTTAVILALAIVGLLANARHASAPQPLTYSARFLVSLFLIIPLALGYLVNVIYPFHPVHSERLLLLAAPAFYLLIAVGIVALCQRRIFFGIAAILIMSAINGMALADFYTVPRYPNDDYRPVLAQIAATAQPGDLYLGMYPWQMGYLETEYHGAPLTVIETPNDAWINQPAQMQRDLDAALQAHPRIWLPALQTQGRLLEDALDANLRPRLYSILDTWVGTTRLELFARAADAPQNAPALAFENNLTLNWGVSTQPVAAGQDPVWLWLDPGASVADGLVASARLLDSRGNLWMQDDREISGGMQRLGLLIPAGTPPGHYDLRLAVYRKQNYAPLKPMRNSNQNDITLANIPVTAPPQPNLAAVAHYAPINFTDGLHLLGYELAPVVRPGDPIPLTLFWQAAHTLDQNYSVTLQIQDARGNNFGTTEAQLARGIYPPTRWQPGELIRDPQTITLRGNAPDGDYTIALTLITPATNTHKTRIIGAFTAKGRPHYFGAPTPQYPSDTRIGEIARLVGYDIRADQRTIQVVLYWRALGTTPTSFTGFAHLVDANGTLRAQRDQIPGAGATPTTTWVKDEYLVDVYAIPLPLDAPPGNYRIEIGMYDAATGARLTISDANNQPLGDSSLLPIHIPVP